MSDGEECGYALYIVSFHYMDIELWPKLFSEANILVTKTLPSQPKHDIVDFLCLSQVDVDLIRIRQGVGKDHCY